MMERIHEWLAGFDLHPTLGKHTAAVIVALPELVRVDLMGDPAFAIVDYEPGPNAFIRVPARVPAAAAGQSGLLCRSVVLKRTLNHRPAAFIRYIIAHEFAHAHLRNEGRWAGDDPELAADALAAEWGFPRPG